jgi:hypothetical protein
MPPTMPPATALAEVEDEFEEGVLVLDEDEVGVEVEEDVLVVAVAVK